MTVAPWLRFLFVEMRNDLLEAARTKSIIEAFYEVYNLLGFGFRERFHADALEIELGIRGHAIGREVEKSVFYKGRDLGKQRIDMIVDDRVVVEIKSTLILPTNATQQLYNYLRVSNLQVGLLLHFGDEPRFYRKVARLKTVN